jgi:hypothetical protein
MTKVAQDVALLSTVQRAFAQSGSEPRWLPWFPEQQIQSNDLIRSDMTLWRRAEHPMQHTVAHPDIEPLCRASSQFQGGAHRAIARNTGE